jgi:hypothetical protein
VYAYGRSDGFRVPRAVVTGLPLLPGTAVLAFSRDGSTIAVQAAADEVQTFARAVAGTWWRSGTFRPVSANGNYGAGLALSASGSTLIVDASGFKDGESRGGGYRYVWTGGQWQWGGMLLAPTDEGAFLHGPLTSADGHRVVLDGYDLSHGAIQTGFVFTLP